MWRRFTLDRAGDSLDCCCLPSRRFYRDACLPEVLPSQARSWSRRVRGYCQIPSVARGLAIFSGIGERRCHAAPRSQGGQAASRPELFAVWVAIASINGGDRQS